MILRKCGIETELSFFDGGQYSSDKADRAKDADMFFLIPERSDEELSGTATGRSKYTKMGKGVYLELKSFVSSRKQKPAYLVYVEQIDTCSMFEYTEYGVRCEPINFDRANVTNTRDYVCYAKYENTWDTVSLDEALGLKQSVKQLGTVDSTSKYGEIIL